eukprot:SAG31_NODE_151_length_22216_cov_37.572139_7_plen_514_part_00
MIRQPREGRHALAAVVLPIIMWQIMCASTMAAAAPAGESEDCSIAATVAAVARGAQQLRGNTPATEALLWVKLQPETAEAAGILLSGFGMHTARDLALLGGGPEAEELMQQLKSNRGISIGDRSKLRLLIGDSDHVARIAQSDARCGTDFRHRNPTERPHLYMNGRRLQDEYPPQQEGLSVDTIAIAITVLLGAAGYIIQAYSARQAEHAAVQRQSELQISETRRQREHEQLLAQISRTERVVDECCGPCLRVIYSMGFCLQAFNAECIVLLEETNPEIVARLASAVAAGFEVHEDGTVVSKTSNRDIYLGSPPPSLVSTIGNFTMGYGSSYGAILGPVWTATSLSKPHAAIVYDAVRSAISADSSTRLSETYRRYVKLVLMPQLRNIATIFESHGSILDLPSKEFLMQKFPDESWNFIPEDTYVHRLFACLLGWERLMDAWADGDFSNHEPADGRYIPISGLVSTLTWVQTQGRARQRELIGMTKADEKDIFDNWDNYTSNSSSATADEANN